MVKNICSPTLWNAPKTAFTLQGEFFNERSVDDSPLFGFHRMNAFAGMKLLESIHFHDVKKMRTYLHDTLRYRTHLQNIFIHQKQQQHEHLFDCHR